MNRVNKSSAFLGFFDRCQDGEASGWSVDRRSIGRPTALHVLIDGQEVSTVICDGARDDVRAQLGHPTGKVGFRFAIPNAFLDGATHRIAFRFADRSAVPFVTVDDKGVERRTDDCTFAQHPPTQVRGFVDGLAQGFLRGWVVRSHPRRNETEGNCQVRVTCDGVLVAQLRANRYRGDVAGALACDPNCGFQLALPPAFRKNHPQTFRFHVLPEDVELENSPIVTRSVDDQLEGKLLEISDTMDRLYREFVALRREVNGLIPAPGFTLGDYDRWARRYYDVLRTRVAAARAQRGDRPEPLVSILVPTYKPLLSDFRAALDSVIAQTWRNWELVIVDDGSGDAALTAVIRSYAAADSRIRAVPKSRNGGISHATNAAIAAARGTWIAFFDHDDLLTDVAVEVMVRAAEDTGARMLFSDEDKIDQAGFFLEPNLKPDWNHRYMLGCNYVCHLLVVAADVVRAVGPLRPAYDGAQDHDYILRVSELIGAVAIHHVPEILYHWRKTPNSTASDVSRKDYAKDAGIRAVGDHLARLGRPAEVSNIRGLTLYGVKWLYDTTPKVSIVIPFKEQVDTTRRCVELILRKTDYADYGIVLVDNWSTSREAERFCAEAVTDPRVRVMRVEEPFNYSRLNNLATAGSDAAFFVFMNNDVFIGSGDWLRLCVNEALADPAVAAVGGRFLYPNGTIQHAGVIVGTPAIAAHAHRGAPDGEYGYIGRIVLSHELTAVTAACMLVRGDAFRAIGGFDEVNLPIAYNDVDLCLRLGERGHKIVYAAEFIAEHHESLSRGSDEHTHHEPRVFYENQYMLERWRDALARDPHYSPFFTTDLQPFFDLRPPVAIAAD